MKELISRMMNESKYKKVSAKEVDNILAGLQQEHAEDGYAVNMASYEVDSFASGTTAQVRTIKKQGIGNNWRDIKTFVGYLLIGNTYHEVPKEDWPKYAIGNMDSKMAESKVNESVTVTDRKAAENILNLLVDAQDLAGRAFKLGDEDRNSDEDIYNSISDVIGMVEYLLNIKESKKKVNEEDEQKDSIHLYALNDKLIKMGWKFKGAKTIPVTWDEVAELKRLAGSIKGNDYAPSEDD